MKTIRLNETDLTMLVKKVLREQESQRYMFFSNLEQIKRQCELLLEQNHDTIESILEDGHDWAQDHIAEAKNNMDQVFDFLMNQINDNSFSDSTGEENIMESELDSLVGEPISLIKIFRSSKYNPDKGDLETVTEEKEIEGVVKKIMPREFGEVAQLVVKYEGGTAYIMYDKSRDRFIDAQTTFSYQYLPSDSKSEEILNLFKNEFYGSKNDKYVMEGKKKSGTPLCARGKAAAKEKFKVYPSAYANGFAVQVCKGKMKGLDGKKRCSQPYC